MGIKGKRLALQGFNNSEQVKLSTYNTPSITIKLLKSQESIKDCYTEEELQALLKKPNIKKCLFLEYRNWGMTCFLIATGVRVGSLINIQIKDIGLHYGYIPDTVSGDSEEIDAYIIGEFVPVEEFEGTVVAVIHRKNDNEDKLVVSKQPNKYNKEEIEALVEFQERFFDTEIIVV